MQPPLEPPNAAITVKVNDRDFTWTPAQGLDPAAAFQLDGCIMKEANRFSHLWAQAGMEREDLLQVGRMACLDAAQRFNPAMGVPFLAYAKPWFKGEILKALSHPLVRTPSGERALVHQPEAFVQDEWSGDGWSVVEGIYFDQNPAQRPVEEAAEVAEREAQLDAAMDLLPPLHRQVLERVEGLGGRKAAPLRKVAQDLQVTRHRVEKCHRSGLVRLKSLLRGPGGGRARRQRPFQSGEARIRLHGGAPS